VTDLNQRLTGSIIQTSPLLRGIDPATYEIRLASRLDKRWIERFYGVHISYDEQGQTCLSGSFDQAALHGMFNKIRDLNLVILSVMRK
jgi:hypothetical protein